MSSPLNLLSVVIPVYNEEAALPLLLVNLGEVLVDLPCRAEILFVNDGSQDGTGHLLAEAAAEDDRVKVIELSRNFGHQMALTAGLDFSAGDAVIVMDADLQDPPEMILTLVEKYRQGYEVVYGRRTRRHGETCLKRATATLFYWLMRKAIQAELPDNTGDFRLMSRVVVDTLKGMREQHRFMRGMIVWLGFRQVAVPFERPARVAGQTKYSLRKMLVLAWRAITSFSGLPLRLSFGAGILLILIAAGGALATVYQAFILQSTVPKWWFLASLQTGLTGVTLVALGLIGDYLARMYDELKQRPLYVIRGLVNVIPPAGCLSKPAVCPALPIPKTDQFAGRIDGEEVSSL